MNTGQVVFAVLDLIVGALFVWGAMRAVATGAFLSPRRIIHGTAFGLVLIRRDRRPLAFWWCVTAYFAFGFGIVACVWLIF